MINKILPIMSVIPRTESFPKKLRSHGFHSSIPKNSPPGDYSIAPKKIKQQSAGVSHLERVAINFFSPDSDLPLRDRFYPLGKMAALASSVSREAFPEEGVEIEKSTYDLAAKNIVKQEDTTSGAFTSKLLSSAYSQVVEYGRSYVENIIQKALEEEGIIVTEEVLKKIIPSLFASGPEKETLQKELQALLKKSGTEFNDELLNKIEDISTKHFTTKISNVLKANISSSQTIKILQLINSKGNFQQVINEFLDIGRSIALSRVAKSVPAEMRPYLTPDTFLLIKQLYEGKGLEHLQNSFYSKIKEKIDLPDSIPDSQVRLIAQAIFNQDNEKLKDLLKKNGIEPKKALASLQKELLIDFQKELTQFFKKSLSPSEQKLLAAIFSDTFDPTLLIKSLKVEGAKIVTSLCKEFKVPNPLIVAMNEALKGEGSTITILTSSIQSATLETLQTQGKKFLQSNISRITVIGPFISGTGSDIIEGGIAVIKGDKDGLKKALLNEDFLRNVGTQLGFPKDFLTYERFTQLYEIYQNRLEMLKEFSKSFKDQSEEMIVEKFLREQETRLDFPKGSLRPDIFLLLEKNIPQAFGKKMVKDGVKVLVQAGLLLVFPVAGVAGVIASTGMNYGVDFAVDAVENILRAPPPQKNK